MHRLRWRLPPCNGSGQLVDPLTFDRGPSVHSVSPWDNYELLARDVHAADRALQTLQQICNKKDICLHESNTYRWTCISDDKKQLRAVSITPTRAARDLGVMFNIMPSKEMHFWSSEWINCLLYGIDLPAAMRASFDQKLWSLKIVSLARSSLYLFHCPQLTGSHGWSKSRSRTRLLVFLMHGQVDLECHALMDAMIQFRLHVNPDLVDVTLSAAACTPAKQRKPRSSRGLSLSVCTFMMDGFLTEREDMFMFLPVQFRRWKRDCFGHGNIMWAKSGL